MGCRLKKIIKKTIAFTAVTSTILFCLNKLANALATVKNLLKTDNGHFYKWKFGKIYYQKEGSGPALLLLHDLDCDRSSNDWSRILPLLSSQYTVYTIDLLGCGRSDRPNLTYTNYMYVQLLEGFIRDIIKEPVAIAAAGRSVTFSLLAAKNSPELITEALFFNPQSFREQSRYPRKEDKIRQTLISLPIFGTAYYNLKFSYSANINRAYEQYFASRRDVPSQFVNTCYESAHLMNSTGRYLYASLAGGYTNMNINRAVQTASIPIHIIVGKEEPVAGITLETFKYLNPEIDSAILPNCKHFPYYETPDQTAEAMRKLLTKDA